MINKKEQNIFIELENLSKFIKEQSCDFTELENLIKQQNSNVELEKTGKLIFVKLNDYKMIINKSKYDNKWYVL